MVIGLDGATWDLMQPWIDAGQLPNLATLQSQGAWGKLASTIQPLSAPAWTSFLTGVNQGKHGIFDFVRRRSNSYTIEFTNSTMIGAPTLFEYLGQAGLRVASINVPFTFPVWPINGVMVGGPFAPGVGPEIMYPPHLWDEFSRAVRDYVVLPDYVPKSDSPEEKLAADLVACVRKRTLAAEFLLSKEDWDAIFVVYTATDQAQHAFWRYLPRELGGDESSSVPDSLREAILSVYREVDEGVGRILRYATDSTLVVVLSDHGSGRLDVTVNLDCWLAQQGYLIYRGHKKSVHSSYSSLVSSFARVYGLLVPRLVRQHLRRVLGQHFQAVKGQLATSLLTTDIDWAQTRAYALGYGDIYVNLKGREPEGIVAPGAEYEMLINDIAVKLEALVSPNGEPIVEHVYHGGALYHGDHARQGPDLTVVLRDHRFHCVARHTDADLVFEDPNRWLFDARPLTGGHRPDGIMMLSGEVIRPDTILQDARIFDLAPTILTALGLPVPAEMDGRVLQEAFKTMTRVSMQTSEEIKAREQGRFAGYSPEEEARIEQRLTDLGYI